MKQSKRRSRGEWEEIVADQLGSGLSAAAYCRGKALGLASFYHWRRRIRKMEPDSEGKIASAGSFIDMGQIDAAGGLSATVAKPWVVTVDMGEGFKLTLQRG